MIADHVVGFFEVGELIVCDIVVDDEDKVTSLNGLPTPVTGHLQARQSLIKLLLIGPRVGNRGNTGIVRNLLFGIYFWQRCIALLSNWHEIAAKIQIEENRPDLNPGLM